MLKKMDGSEKNSGIHSSTVHSNIRATETGYLQTRKTENLSPNKEPHSKGGAHTENSKTCATLQVYALFRFKGRAYMLAQYLLGCNSGTVNEIRQLRKHLCDVVGMNTAEGTVQDDVSCDTTPNQDRNVITRNDEQVQAWCCVDTVEKPFFRRYLDLDRSRRVRFRPFSKL